MSAPLLIELLTEELPPKALERLSALIEDASDRGSFGLAP